jgi:hypothetical protein
MRYRGKQRPGQAQWPNLRLSDPKLALLAQLMSGDSLRLACNATEAARMLGLSRSSLYEKVRRHRIRRTRRFGLFPRLELLRYLLEDLEPCGADAPPACGSGPDEARRHRRRFRRRSVVRDHAFGRQECSAAISDSPKTNS